MSTTHWNPYHNVVFEMPATEPEYCKYYHSFAAWGNPLCLEALARPDVISLNQFKLRLCDRYFDFLAVVPKAHRECVSERGHRCIYHVWLDFYKQIKAAELSLTPPLLFLPPVPPPPPPVQVVEIPGITIGDFMS